MKFSENESYGKMIQGLRHAEEASVEMGVLRTDPRWATVANMLKEMRAKIIAMAAARVAH